MRRCLRPVGLVVKDIAVDAGGLGLDTRAGQIERYCQRLVTAASFLCYPGAEPWKWAPALVTRFGVMPRV